MPSGHRPQITDSVFIPEQSDTSLTVPFRQDSTELPTEGPIVDSFVIVKDSVAVHASSPASGPARIENQASKDIYQQDTSDSKDYVWNFNRNFLEENPLTGIQYFRKKDSLKALSVQEAAKNTEITVISRELIKEDWLTGLGLVILFLFIWIRIFYGKFYTMLADSITNYQISVKVYLEKNILTRRVSLILDLIYFIVFAAFLYELVSHFQIVELYTSEIVMFGLVFGIIFTYSMIRIIILRLTGFLFHNISVFAEYVHHSYIFNKGLGIALFPIIIMVIFFPPQLVIWALMAGIVIYLVTFVLKVIRAYEIIIRKDILLFYLILYLCTLEILPLLLGYKVMKALILSY